MHHEKYYIGDQNCVCVKWHKIKSRKKLMKFLLLLESGIKTSTWGSRHWSRICVRLLSCGPGFESDAFSINSHIFNSNCHCVEKKTRIINIGHFLKKTASWKISQLWMGSPSVSCARATTFEQVGKYSVLDVPPPEAGTWPRTGTNTAKLLCTYLGTSRRILAMYLPRYL